MMKGRDLSFIPFANSATVMISATRRMMHEHIGHTESRISCSGKGLGLVLPRAAAVAA